MFSEKTPASERLKKELNVADLVLISDTPIRSYVKETRDMLDTFEQKYHVFMLEDALTLKTDIEEIIKKFTKDASPPHLFYKQKYFASNRAINYYYSTGDLETVMGIDPLVVH